MASLGPIPVPAPLERFLPYMKFIVALAGVLATVLAAIRVGGLRRQAFLVPIGSFASNRNQAALFAELDAAAVAFYRAGVELGIAEGHWQQ